MPPPRNDDHSEYGNLLFVIRAVFFTKPDRTSLRALQSNLMVLIIEPDYNLFEFLGDCFIVVHPPRNEDQLD